MGQSAAVVSLYRHVHCVSKKTVQNCFCQNFVKFPPILIIFYTLIWYAFYELQSGNGVGPILTAPERTRGMSRKSAAVKILEKTVVKQIRWWKWAFNLTMWLAVLTDWIPRSFSASSSVTIPVSFTDLIHTHNRLISIDTDTHAPPARPTYWQGHRVGSAAVCSVYVYNVCSVSFLVFGCQYQCNWLSKKTCLWNDLLRL